MSNLIFRGKDVPMSERSITAEDFERIANMVATDWSAGPAIVEALRIAARVMKPGVIAARLPTDAALRDYCGCAECRNTIESALRKALTETTDV